MNRFFVPPSWITEGHARLTGEVARQISRVLRMSPGDEITLLDNTGMEYLSRLSRCAINTVEAEVLSAVAGPGEPSIQITLYQGILKGDKFQWVLQKGTELGVANFVPIVCKRSVPRQRDGRSESRYPRWRKIIAEAAEQSGRSLLPTLGEPVPSLAQDHRRGGGAVGPQPAAHPGRAGTLRRGLPRDGGLRSLHHPMGE